MAWTAVAATLAACGGDGEPPPPPGFTAAMVQGKTFYEEVLTAPDQEKTLITFSTGTNATFSLAIPLAAAEVPVTWSIDASGRLILQAGPDRITVTLVADAATYLDATADDGTGPSSVRLFKTIPFGATLPDRFAVADRDFAGAAQTVGVASFGAGTGVFTDGFFEDPVTWAGAADGSISLSSTVEENVVYLLAGSTTASPKSLRVVGRRYDAATTAFTGIIDSVLAETPAKSGFTAAMVDGKVVYRENTAAQNRSIIRYLVGGGRDEWYEDLVQVAAWAGSWALLPLSGSLVELPAGGPAQVAAMLVEDAPTRWNLLVNDGSVITPASVTEIVALSAASVPGVWSATEHLLDGTADPLGTITLNGDGSGTGPNAEALTWSMGTDGSVLVDVAGAFDIAFFALATSALPNTLELAGAGYAGPTFLGTTVLTMRK